MTRRDWIGGCCMAVLPFDCCTLAEAPSGAVRIAPGLVAIDLERTPELRRTGGAVKVVDAGRKLQIVVARPEKERYVALSQRCTHGGGSLTYVHRHRHLYCTCWGHAQFALDGSVVRWPNTQ